MNKIIRTPVKAEGGITKNEKEKMDLITKKWIDIAFRTTSIDKEKITNAIYKLYESANLEKPRVVIVPSPLVGRIASGIAASVWYLRKTDVATNVAMDDATRVATDAATCVATNFATRIETSVKTRDATDVAMDVATHDATRVATDVATSVATNVVMDVATRDATDVATYIATNVAMDVATRVETDAATRVATDAATCVATDVATDAATCDATDDWLNNLIKKYTPNNFQFTIQCIKKSWILYQGGNMWSAFCSYAEAMRDVLNLKGLKCWDKYKAWEDSAKEGGFRFMHEKFCIVSDFPERIMVDEQNRSHNEHGASHRWRDGFEIYNLHGVRFPKELYMKIISREMEMSEILAIVDIDQRVQAMKFAKNGLREFYKSENGKIIDECNKIDVKNRIIHYELWEIPQGKIFNKKVHFMIYDCPSAKKRNEIREYSKGVPEFKTCAEAMSWGMSSDISQLKPNEWLQMIPLVHES